MGRLRKDKGGKKGAPNEAAPSKKAKSKSATKNVLKEQVLALGGDEADVELLRDVDDDAAVQGSGKQDKKLSRDVSKLLRELKLPSGKADAEVTEAKSKKEKEKGKRSRPAQSDAPSGASQAEVGSRNAGPKPVKLDDTKSSATTKSQKGKKGKRSAEDASPGKPVAKRGEKVSEPAKPPASELPTPSVPVASSSKSKLLVPGAPDWYNFLPPLPTSSKPVPTPSATQLSAFLSRASSLHASEITNFAAGLGASGGSASDQAFLRNILAGGTLSDRLSALTLTVQGAPLHNTRALETLKGMAEKGRGGVNTAQEGDKGKARAAGREERLKAARAIMDWWVGGGAPSRKLKYFRDQPLLHPDVTDQHLVLWYYEDWLKKFFFTFLQILEAFSLDTLVYVRTQSLAFISTLLRSTPEQEHNLLRLLVNKLGDTESSVSARTSYYILQVLQEHPAMKSVIIRETTALIMRPTPPPTSASLSAPSQAKPNTHIRFSDDPKPPSKAAPTKPEKSTWHAHARYYAAITFNQIVLSTSDADRAAARTLIDVYFQLFREVVGERQAEPAAEDDAPAPEELKDKRKEKDKKPRPKKGKGQGTGKEVRGAAGFAEVEDASAKLVSAILTGVNRALPYARFGGADVEFARHMDTLFLLAHTSTFNISLRALSLIQHVAASLPAASPVVARYHRALYAALLDARLHTTRNQALFLNLLFKSLKGDAEPARVMAFVKRFCQVLAGGFGGAEFVAGGLWLLGEGPDPAAPAVRCGAGAACAHGQAPASVAEGAEYDAHKRDPLYAHAESSALWELTPLTHHAHPTVALLARQLLSDQPLTSSPDLTLYTLAHFLDRFVYKNPKKLAARGASAMQPSAAGGADGVRRVRADVQETPLNVDGWWRRGEGGVPADQVFFQRYFAQKHAKERAMAGKAEKRKAKRDGSDAESDEDEDEDEAEGDALPDEEDAGSGDEDSDPEEAEIWKAMRVSMPKVGDDDNDDDLMAESDDLPSGMDDSDEDSALGPDLDDDDDDDASPDEAEEDVEEDAEEPSDASEDGGDDSDALSLAEASDADDLVDLDAEVPSGLIEYDGPASDEEEWTGLGAGAGEGKKRKRKGEEKEGARGRKKKLRSLPTFASYDDYARMIEDAPEDDL
ncbi:CBF/Mak21 family-domain-containing protein [Gloeopeniophorella convolvens]|nr:CBF/Mak21 family-domain-containing protein [Gloeopeniophorella convolvens]